MRVVLVVEEVMVKRSVKPVVEKFRWACVQEKENRNAPEVPHRKICKSREDLVHKSRRNYVEKYVIVPAPK